MLSTALQDSKFSDPTRPEPGIRTGSDKLFISDVRVGSGSDKTLDGWVGSDKIYRIRCRSLMLIRQIDTTARNKRVLTIPANCTNSCCTGKPLATLMK